MFLKLRVVYHCPRSKVRSCASYHMGLFERKNSHGVSHITNYSIAVQCSKRKKFVLSSTNLQNSYICGYRHFSSTWLNNLVEFQSKFFTSVSQSSTVEALMKSIIYIHELTGMSWWLTIVTTTVGLRFIVTFPLTVYQNYITSKVENLHIEMKSLIKQLGIETTMAIKKYGFTETQAKHMHMRSAKRIWQELIERENCHPSKAGLVLLFQIPLWIVGSMSYRNFASMGSHNDINAQLTFMELSVGGFGWLPNLTEVDHSLILPIMMGITNLLIIEVNRLSHQTIDSRWKKFVTNFFRCFSIGLIPIAAYMPGCVVLYWTTSSVYGLAQNLILLHPKVRRICGIPVAPSEKPNPYLSMYNKLVKKPEV